VRLEVPRAVRQQEIDQSVSGFRARRREVPRAAFVVLARRLVTSEAADPFVGRHHLRFVHLEEIGQYPSPEKLRSPLRDRVARYDRIEGRVVVNASVKFWMEENHLFFEIA
jgi:hypothetical protein